MPEVELRIAALAAHVRTARLVAAALGRRLGLDALTIDEVKVAVGEACARAVHVHPVTGAGRPIVVQFRDDEQILEVAVMDCGPSGASLPAAETIAASYGEEIADPGSGVDVASLAPVLGLAMIAGLVDDVSVEDRQDLAGTVVTMRWPIVSF